jgi:hypothetical protein
MKYYSLCIAAMVFFTSCKKDKEENTTLPQNTNPETGYLYGAFVVNEGSFMSNNGSMSYVDAQNEITNDVYLQVNGFELGDVLQSFMVSGNEGYAVLNNSQKVVVVDMKTMTHTAEITGFDYPRYLQDLGNGKAYLTNGNMAGDIKVINLATKEIEGSITVGNGPEKMLKVGNEVFVCNSGGWDLDHTISVIDISSGSVIHTIEVGDRPMDLVQDASGDIWVLCAGNDSWMTGGETLASLYRINSNSHIVEANQTIGSVGVHPKNIAVDATGNVIYFENNGVFSFQPLSAEPVFTSFISEPVGSLDVNPSTGDVWTSSVSDFTNPSTVTCRNAQGNIRFTLEAGIGANAVVFN